MKTRLASLIVIVSSFMGGGILQAQIIGQLDANIPFPFHVGSAKFPAGKYIIRPLDDTDGSLMEIQSAEGKSSALFEVRPDVAQTSPSISELIFNQSGDRYFLAKLFDEGVSSGNAVVDIGYSKKYGVNLQAGAVQHVPAHHHRK